MRAAFLAERGERDQGAGRTEQEAREQPPPAGVRDQLNHRTAAAEVENHDRKAYRNEQGRAERFRAEREPWNASLRRIGAAGRFIQLESWGAPRLLTRRSTRL